MNSLTMLFLTVFIIVNVVMSFGHDAFKPIDYENNTIAILPHSRTARQTVGYICVPIGTCLTINTIDPRIVTPGVVALCPAGQVACYGATAAVCGQRTITGASTADGPATLGAYPWQAYILNQTGYTGSGVLIDTFHVLTAAHKVNLNTATPGNIRVYLGVYDPINIATAQMRTAISVTLHPNFDANTLRNDIAVIRLSSPVTLGANNVASACLAAAGTSFVGQTCYVSGWGRTGFTINDAPTSPQRQVSMPIVNMDTCYASMAAADVLGSSVDTFLDRLGEICAGGQANRDACTQDGGSPLVCADGVTGRFSIAGLVIWGKNCGRANVYGVYVNVPYYRAWIDTTIATLNAG